MTAYADSSVTRNRLTADVTIRSYNSRHLDVALYLPESCQAFEEDIKKIVSSHHHRGRVEIRVSIEDDDPETDQFAVDERNAVSYFKALTALKNRLGLAADITMDQLLSGRNIIVPVKKELEKDLLWAVLSEAVRTASENLLEMRVKEGRNLKKDLEERIRIIENDLSEVEDLAGEIPLRYKARLEERISRLTADTDAIDPVRLAQEAAVLSDRSDVSEEIVRLHSHIRQFHDILNAGEAQGRKLNFLIQEFNREFNTIGSKAGSARLSHRVVELKSVLEQIREQVQNIE